MAHIVLYQNECEHPADTGTNSNRSDLCTAGQQNDIRMYFDVHSSELLVKHETPIRSIAMYSFSGTKIASQLFSSPEIRWQIPVMQPGIFVVRIEDELNSVFLKKIPVIY